MRRNGISFAFAEDISKLMVVIRDRGQIYQVFHFSRVSEKTRFIMLELRYCRRDHKVKGGLERASLKADLIRKVRYVLPRSLSTRYLRRHLSIECEIQFTAKGFLVLLSCGPETITKV